MIKRDDAITIKELVKRSNSNRSRVWKNIISEWQKDPVKRNFIFQVDAPSTRTGKMWFIKKPAVNLAIQTLSSLSKSPSSEQG